MDKLCKPHAFGHIRPFPAMLLPLYKFSWFFKLYNEIGIKRQRNASFAKFTK